MINLITQAFINLNNFFLASGITFEQQFIGLIFFNLLIYFIRYLVINFLTRKEYKI